MRTRDIKPKVVDEIEIPENLVQFFDEVHQLIEQGDEYVTTPSDDLIQADFACGGLLEEGGDRFSFSYFPGKETKATWEFELSASDIAAIAQGKQNTLRLWRCHTPGCGYRFGSADDTCIDCDYIDDERDHKRSVLASLRACGSREEWVREYLRHFPGAHPLRIIGDYNGELQLPASWGAFSVVEMQSLVTRFQGEE